MKTLVALTLLNLLYNNGWFTFLLFYIVVCDFVEDPGTVTEINPDIYNKDIFEDDAERQAVRYATKVEKFMSDLQPIDMLTVELEANGEQTFYINVDKFPT